MHCERCGGVLPDGAAFCPKCGAGTSGSPPAKPASSVEPIGKKSRGTKGCLTVAGIVLGLLVLIAIVAPSPKNSNSVGTADAPASLGDHTAKQNSDESASPWSYSQDEDKVRGGTTYYASTTSTNSIAQDFPYDSETTMTMTVRRSPAHGMDVILTISSGQMMCPSYDGCSGTVRFDNGPPERVRFNGPADNSSETVFVVGAKQFIAKVKRAEKVTVEKTLYQAGSPQFEFNVSGLKWDH